MQWFLLRLAIRLPKSSPVSFLLFVACLVLAARGVFAREQAFCTHILQLRDRARNDPAATKELERIAQSGSNYDKSFAIAALGALGSKAKDSTHVIADALDSTDGSLRHTAGWALFKLGKDAAPGKGRLVAVIYAYPNQGTAEAAARTLRAIGDPSPDVIAALSFMSIAKDSYRAETAREALAELQATRR